MLPSSYVTLYKAKFLQTATKFRQYECKKRKRTLVVSRVKWPCGLRRRSVAAWLLYRAFISRWRHGRSSLLFVVCHVQGSLCNQLITCSEECCRVCMYVCVCVCVCVFLMVCDLEISIMRWPRPELGSCSKSKFSSQRCLRFPHRLIFKSGMRRRVDCLLYQPFGETRYLLPT